MNILGVSALFHDSAAALVADGEIVAAAEEERFSRRKHDGALPRRAMRSCLEHLRGDLDAVVYYEDPVLALDRFAQTAVRTAPRSGRTWERGLAKFASQRIPAPAELRALSSARSSYVVPHHFAHAGAAFYPSPFAEAAILIIDGFGEWASTTIAHGDGARIEPLAEVRYPHSLGLMYMAFTVYCGFKPNSGEYKLMGLAPFGTPRYADAIRERMIDLRADGSFRVSQQYFSFDQDQPFTEAFERFFGQPARVPEAAIEQLYADVAASVQAVTETAILALAAHAKQLTGSANLCLGGGVALNCVANGKLARSGSYERLFIQPASGDAGNAIGAALCAYYELSSASREPAAAHDSMHGAFLGPSYEPAAAEAALHAAHLAFERYDDEAALAGHVADRLADGAVVGLFRGRMEFGPRALGHRSILAAASSSEMRTMINRKIKFRESWRPFAAMLLEEDLGSAFDLELASPYMLLVAPVRSWDGRSQNVASEANLIDRLNGATSVIPAVTHVDGTCRIQTVDGESDPFLDALLRAYRARTGYSAIVNTSMNVRGEPIVCDPEEAIHCFLSTGMDMLVLDAFVAEKSANASLVRVARTSDD